MLERIIFEEAIDAIAKGAKLSKSDKKKLRSELIDAALEHKLKVYPKDSYAPYNFNNVGAPRLRPVLSARFGSAAWDAVKTTEAEIYLDDIDEWLPICGLRLEFRFADRRVDDTSITDVQYLATSDSIVAAFTQYGLTAEKIRNGSTKFIRDAKKLQGQGGKGRAVQPMFCPYEIMQGLVQKARPKKLSEKRGWEILELRFPSTYSKFQKQDPRKYT